MASGPQRRRRGIWLGAALAIGAAAAVSLSQLVAVDAPAPGSTDLGAGTIRADGKLVLRIFAPALY